MNIRFIKYRDHHILQIGLWHLFSLRNYILKPVIFRNSTELLMIDIKLTHRRSRSDWYTCEFLQPYQETMTNVKVTQPTIIQGIIMVPLLAKVDCV